MTALSLTLPKTARLLGLDRSLVRRKAKVENWPLIREPGRWPRISIPELEKIAGRIFTPEQIEAAARAPTPGYVPRLKKSRPAIIVMENTECP